MSTLLCQTPQINWLYMITPDVMVLKPGAFDMYEYACDLSYIMNGKAYIYLSSYLYAFIFMYHLCIYTYIHIHLDI